MFIVCAQPKQIFGIQHRGHFERRLCLFGIKVITSEAPYTSMPVARQAMPRMIAMERG